MIAISKAHIDSLSSVEIKHVYDLMVYAYSETEKEIWGADYKRLELDEFRVFIENGEIYIACLNNIIVGSIHVFAVDSSAYTFSLLNADFSKKGNGIGSALVAEAEKIARIAQAESMHIEVLRPRDFVPPQKKKLHDWYQSMGYDLVHSASFLDLKPDKVDKAKKLIVPSSFDCYLKTLD